MSFSPTFSFGGADGAMVIVEGNAISDKKGMNPTIFLPAMGKS